MKLNIYICVFETFLMYKKDFAILNYILIWINSRHVKFTLNLIYLNANSVRIFENTGTSFNTMYLELCLLIYFTVYKYIK